MYGVIHGQIQVAQLYCSFQIHYLPPSMYLASVMLLHWATVCCLNHHTEHMMMDNTYVFDTRFGVRQVLSKVK